MEGKVSFDEFFKDLKDVENAEKVLPVIRKCIQESNNEGEVLLAIEIGSGLINVNVNEIEEKLFCFACPAAKNIFKRKLEFLENLQLNSSSGSVNFSEVCSLSLTVCLKIISFFEKVLNQIAKFTEVNASQIRSLLLSSAEVIYYCFLHCKDSEKIYGAHFGASASCLGHLFKCCSEFQENFSNFLTERTLFGNYSDNVEVKLLSDILNYLSKSGLLLIHLELKAMVKTWKTYAFLVEKYSAFLKNEHHLEKTINGLCCDIISNIEMIAKPNFDDKNTYSKSVKLACFYLKLVIKFCEIFNGFISGCHESLFNLLLTLCRCNILPIETTNFNGQDSLNQLSAGVDALLSKIISDKGLVEQCAVMNRDIEFLKNKIPEFLFLCCLVLKKLLHCNKTVRNLWFNNNNNILDWLLTCAAFGEVYLHLNLQLPFVLVSGSQKKFIDLYEYVLVSASAYFMTVASDDYFLVEKTLLKNLLQSNLFSALLSIDIWCLLNRFSNPELSWNQITKLVRIFHQLRENNLRVEKCYLRSLILRLISCLTSAKKKMLFQTFHPSFILDFCEKIYALEETFNKYILLNPLIIHLLSEKGVFQGSIANDIGNDNNCVSEQYLETCIVQLWKFNCKVLLGCSKNLMYLKMICTLTACYTDKMNPKNLLLVLKQIKKIIHFKPVSSLKMYFIKILNSLSTLKIPRNSFQQNIIAILAEIFRMLLMSEEVLVKQKILETFYSFSHHTEHSEIITLSVFKSPTLKQLIANYFQKELGSMQNFNLNEYFLNTCQRRYLHICQSQISENLDNRRLNIENIENNRHSEQLKEVVCLWKKYGEEIIKNYEELTELQKKEIEAFTKIMLSLAH